MSPIKKSLTALAAAAALATVGFATAQTPDATTSITNADGSVTTTQTITDNSTQVIPAPPTGVMDVNKPKGTVAPVDKQANGAFGMANSVMTTGVTAGDTRPSIGDHETPPIAPDPTVLAVTTQRTVTTTTEPPAPAPVEAAPVAAPESEPAPAPMPAPRADRN